MILRIIALIFIYACTSLAWFALGGTVEYRTHQQDNKLRHEVGQLWGAKQVQVAPKVYYQTTTYYKVERFKDGVTVSEARTEVKDHYVPLTGSEVQVDLKLEHRRKGLLWYPTYTVGFLGKYKITNPTDETRDIYFSFVFPAQWAIYDDFRFSAGGRQVPEVNLSDGGFAQAVSVGPRATLLVEVGYVSRGMEEWGYNFGVNVNQVRDFTLAMTTDFPDMDFPQNTISPSEKRRKDQGWELVWRFNNLLTGVEIGLTMPQKLNPGPWVSSVSFSAPISLFLFFFLLFIFTTIRGIKVHPMNYFFLGAAFFSFHLLLAYLVDHISIHAAFLISSAVSIALVTTYMRLVVGCRFAFLEIGISQFVYLVLFSYTYFFQGYTGLTITILCVTTLFIVMQVSGRLDWETVFHKQTTPTSPILQPES
ncbi:MAG: inner membrane CreD family protein [Thermodesulfobacteriota bacterium]